MNKKDMKELAYIVSGLKEALGADYARPLAEVMSRYYASKCYGKNMHCDINDFVKDCGFTLGSHFDGYLGTPAEHYEYDVSFDSFFQRKNEVKVNLRGTESNSGLRLESIPKVAIERARKKHVNPPHARPTLESLQKIADRHGVTVTESFGGKRTYTDDRTGCECDPYWAPHTRYANNGKGV
jgi:hypothetical protein